MKPLGSKTIRPKTTEKASAAPILLFALLILHFLKPSPSLTPSPGFPCPTPVYVQLEGDLRNPGVYPLCTSRGEGKALPEKTAWKWPCNSLDPAHAAKVTSGAKVEILAGGQEIRLHPGGMNPYYKVTLGIPLSINRESQEAFTAIPGIGDKLAGRIVRERNRRGAFTRVEEIAEIPGVGKALYKRIEPYLEL